jgi:hypothetical protein
MSTDDQKPDVVDLDIARNKKKSREGRLRNLASMFVSREIERGPFYASMWLYTEFQRAGVEDLHEAYQQIQPYIEEVRKEMYV